MAVAAYASCALSLLRVIDNARHPSRLRFFPDATQIDSLREKICFLQDFFELHSSTITEDVESVARKIPRVALEADILINNYTVDQLYRESQDVRNDAVPESSIYDEMHRVIQQIESVTEALTALKKSQQKPARVQLDKFTCDEPLKNKTVGFDDQLKQVLEKLTGTQKGLVIVPIVGMGGIGKTTLARNVFDHPYNVHHFHVRIWLTISQDYNVERVLRELLKILSDEESGDRSESVLITKLHQKLFGQRYLVVLDDIWSLEAWHDLRRGLPDNVKASRVLVTTRLSDIATSLGCESYSMKFLDEDASWALFSQRAFERGGRSHELEAMGRKISKRCKGLPLLLVVVGGFLASSNMSVEHWRTIAEGISSFANSASDEYCLRVLSLSYNHLPIHLKPCFLYMGRFREDEEVLVSELIRMWLVEGFVKPVRGKSLEESAKNYLEDLIGRNMLLVRKRVSYRNIKTCGIHDLLRDLCVKQYNRERFLEVPRFLPVKYKIDDEVCFLCQAEGKNMAILHSEVLGPHSKYDSKMAVCGSCEGTFPELVARSRFVDAFRLYSQDAHPLMTKHRFIRIAGGFDTFHTVRLLWNLEILEVYKGLYEDRSSIPWKMPQLRHLVNRGFTLPYPAAGEGNDAAVLEHLQRIKTIDQFKCTVEIVRRIPNLRKLGVRYDGECFEEKDWSRFHLQNLALLEKLESLNIECLGVYMDVNAISFPRSLTKLTLYGCQIAWDDLTIVSSLPNLQVLKLKYESVLGEEWNPVEEEFLRLKCLRLEELDLVHWRLSQAHFPALETVFLSYMRYLEAIPREIGELPALSSIYLERCKERIVDSARDIVNDQLCCGNERLVLHLVDYCHWT